MAQVKIKEPVLTRFLKKIGEINFFGINEELPENTTLDNLTVEDVDINVLGELRKTDENCSERGNSIGFIYDEEKQHTKKTYDLGSLRQRLNAKSVKGGKTPKTDSKQKDIDGRDKKGREIVD